MKNGVDEYRTEQKTSKYMHAYASQNACANMIVRVLDHDIKWTYWSLARSPHICVSFRLNRQGWVERKLWEGHANKAGEGLGICDTAEESSRGRQMSFVPHFINEQTMN